MQTLMPPPPADRLTHIAQARLSVLEQHLPTSPLVAPWLNRSWQRCLARGRSPHQRLNFDSVSAAAVTRALDQHRTLLQAARPVIASLAQAVADTRCFTLLTDAHGVVIDVNGTVDRHDARATALARLGVDLSEQAVGTTAIGTTLAELQPVWLHRGEHFFDDTSAYSCAGAPVVGPDGLCMGMLDLTGIDMPERPALRHLVTQSARCIENALVLAQAHPLLLRLQWPGHSLGSHADGLLALNDAGQVLGFNPVAADMLGLLPGHVGSAIDQWFATATGQWFDLARQHRPPLECPLWSGLRLQVWATLAHEGRSQAWNTPVQGKPVAQAPQAPLKAVETALIRQAVETHRGNVAAAAQALGISRATVYRKLGRPGTK